MKNLSIEEVFIQYKLNRNKKIIHIFLKQHSDWFKEQDSCGNLRILLLDMLKNAQQKEDIIEVDFVLLIIQAFVVTLKPNDQHFDYLFSYVNAFLGDYWQSGSHDLFFNQFADVCFHASDEILENTFQRNPNALKEYLTKIASVDYRASDGSDIYIAVHKSIPLIHYLNKTDKSQILHSVFLTHFDERIVEEAQEEAELYGIT